jgi:hypothetical protein
MIDQKFTSRSMFDPSRWELLQKCADAVQYVSGHVLEIGCHKCGVIAWLGQRFPQKQCIAFDRFEDGLSELCPYDMVPSPSYHKGVQGSDYDDSVKFCSEWSNVKVVRGDVRKVLLWENDYKVSLALVDLNLYEPTIAALSWLKGRLSPGAIILVDDCEFEGVKAALEFGVVKWEKKGHMGVVKT